jgi:hypothetical protein
MATLPTDKDTIYVDVDDDITTIIDKVRSSGGKVVALVLPKRAAVFQSIVNMKLLKKSAENAKKNVVLVTSEPGLMPLAGIVGLYVAATPQSKPEVPISIPVNTNEDKADESVTLDEGATEGFTAENAGDKPVGELAGASIPTRPEGIETITLPDEDKPEEETDETADSTKPKKVPKDRHLKVPNFNKFRLRLFLALIVILIIVGLFLALSVLPKASIKINTNTSDENVSLTMTLDPSAQALNLNTLTIPARVEQQQQTTSQQVTTTGQQNNGNTATGTISMTAVEGCNGATYTFPGDIPSGTGVSANGLTYITQQNTTFFGGKQSNKNNCTYFNAVSSTTINAQSAGTKYNVSNTSFTVNGRPDVTATGSANGGTDNIVQVVAQADIDNAEQKLANQNTTTVKSALEQQLTQDGLYPIPATFNAPSPTFTTSSNVGDQATSLTVTQSITYTMYGAKKSDLEALITNNVDGQINTASQSITDDGLSSAAFSVVNTSGSEQVSIQTTAVVGPDIQAATIKKEVAGKKMGDAQTLISQIPGVTSVKVYLSPFWVSSVPTNPNNVTVTVGKSD